MTYSDPMDVCRPCRLPSKVLPPSDLAPVARLADRVRSPNFLEGLGEVLGAYAPGISYAVMHFPGVGRPTVLAHNLSAVLDRRVLLPYVERMYLLDPFHQHWQSQAAPGVWWLEELAPAGFRETEYFATYYRNLGLEREAAAFFSLGEGDGITMSFGAYGALEEGADHVTLMAQVAYLFPLLESLVRQFWLVSSLHLPREEQTPSLLASFGQDRLSERERETAWLILRGHTSPEIASKMGISTGTVKNHRKRLYAKLNISSQAELFRQFMLFQHQSDGRA
ncbi:LuxR C-terminal-related transcriptional regulator [Halomonas denitrificans]|uniref:helix-turn-helix transcriptional regulator n=2 Tax=Halomonadaceae TaxID=28256 RepID=UPI001A902148|nr:MULTISPECIES: LuxR C-terminal-related transcriptional regulator [Halomonas]MBN8410928.1 hypothetical protein [Halomonas litopenaei]MBY6030790.1 LuxR C-terminal-related transcriptional regulator [Halomonas sp. DP8Y7-1]MBY5925485.1 LuxR C-terminal-related transcriptional regulator [Halomonas sp. DP4Y7-2]MBY5969476.1 LuxR C-terminal-related transcriptional regulator [Halomonas denitrificans]MBY6232696.1 LuxR C-terminal-related transcriptional regulator [Halomonas sp. DP4Y7-1]